MNFDPLNKIILIISKRIQHRVRNILKIIPTDPKLLESFDKITNKITGQQAASANNSILFETSSSSSSSSLNTSQCSNNKESFLKQNESPLPNLDSKLKDFSYFFNKDVPLHRILYNLEALSSRIAPLASDSGTIQSSELFQQDFLKSNGLEILIALLKLDTPLNNNDCEIRQNIYILNLQLLR